MGIGVLLYIILDQAIHEMFSKALLLVRDVVAGYRMGCQASPPNVHLQDSFVNIFAKLTEMFYQISFPTIQRKVINAMEFLPVLARAITIHWDVFDLLWIITGRFRSLDFFRNIARRDYVYPSSRTIPCL